MVATSATRDAENREQFFAMTRKVLGVPAEVITGDEEAAMSFAGAIADRQAVESPYLVADVGGGSTELVMGDGFGVRAARSVDVGSVRLTERCLRSDPPRSDEVAEAHRVAAEVLAPAFEAVTLDEVGAFVGVAGTVTTLSAVHMGLAEYQPERIHGSVMTFEAIRETTEWLLASSHEERSRVGSIHPGRVDVIGGGAVVVCELAEQLATRTGITEMSVSEHDILDGVALSQAR
jgi:exopolyphosphatase/guanosine-5'-triphosphate,3'-diphosphate pyrophosphatase